MSLRAKGMPFMTNTEASATTGGARTTAPSNVGAIHVETSARELRLALTGLLLALTLAALDQNIVATALPRITGEFGSLHMTNTDCSRRKSSSARCEPTNPAPPVMR